MKTKLTVIVDNTATNKLVGEWGLSILVEYNARKILVDTGATELFAQNLRALGFDIADIDFATLSHAHYDHANGMERFFAENKKAKFYIRKTTSPNCYFKKFFIRKYIGIPKDILEKFKDRIEIVSGDYKLFDGAYLIGHKSKDLEKIGKRENMYLRTAGTWQPDNFSHEQSLVLDTEKGLVIINSCSHGGASNIIKEVSDTFRDKKVYALIGGLHLYNKTEAEVVSVAEEIKKTGIEFVCTGHCTKEKAYGILERELGDKICKLYCGLVMEF